MKFYSLRLFVALSLLHLYACRNSETADTPALGSKNGIFVEVTEEVKLDFEHNPGVDGSYFMPESIGSGGGFLDYDNDGDLDVYLVNGAFREAANEQPLLKNRLFRQEEDGTFSDVTETSGLGDTGYGMGIAVGDLDNDGDLDLYLTNYGPDVLYRNNGDGTFSNVSREAGIENPSWGCSALFFDYNVDGFLDIFVTNYLKYDSRANCTDRAGREDYCGPDGFAGVSDVLFQNNGDGTFTDVSETSGIAAVASKGLGVASADFNGDHYPDVYVANDGEANHMWINQKDGTFKEQALLLGSALNDLGRSEAGMGVAVGDWDNDRDPDLFITHLRTESNTLYRHAGEQGFFDDSAVTGLAGPSLPYTGFGTGFLDFDHDGDLDLALVNGRVTRGPLLTGNDPPSYWDYYAEPNLLFENNGMGRFADKCGEAPAFCGSVRNSRGLAIGDVDNDGDLDLLVMNEGSHAQLFTNVLPEKGNWLLVRAFDRVLRRDAIGAEVTVRVKDRRISRSVTPGYGYLSSHDPRVHFGLGQTEIIDDIVILWPGGELERFPPVSVNQIITLEKGAGARVSE